MRAFLHWLGTVGGLAYLLVSAARMLIYFMGGPTGRFNPPSPFTPKELDEMQSRDVGKKNFSPYV